MTLFRGHQYILIKKNKSGPGIPARLFARDLEDENRLFPHNSVNFNTNIDTLRDKQNYPDVTVSQDLSIRTIIG